MPSSPIQIPHRYQPRPYQLPILKALDSGIKRAVAVWHRKAGKEKTFWNYMIRQSLQRVGTYFYVFPTYAQAKKVIWEGRDQDGFGFLDHLPRDIVKSKNETDLLIKLVNGSIIQLVGAETYNHVMGTNPIGCVFSEYSLQNPRAWDYLSPPMRINGGWAIFNFTPRAKNHGWDLYSMARGNPDWYVDLLTIDDTGILTEKDLDKERAEGKSEEFLQQEYYCSFEGVQTGSVFGRAMQEAERDGHITGVPWDPDLPVDTWWDIGTGDPTAIWFTQTAGKEIHVIDYYENSGAGVGIDFYARHLQQMPYVWGVHHGPHDLEAHQFAAGGKSTREVAAGLGLRFTITDRLDKQSQINAGRSFIKRCWFDRVKTERGRNALMSYHYEWNDKRKSFSDEPYHDWASNGADAFMQLAVGHKFASPKTVVPIEIIQYTKGQEGTAWMRH